MSAVSGACFENEHSECDGMTPIGLGGMWTGCWCSCHDTCSICDAPFDPDDTHDTGDTGPGLVCGACISSPPNYGRSTK